MLIQCSVPIKILGILASINLAIIGTYFLSQPNFGSGLAFIVRAITTDATVAIPDRRMPLSSLSLSLSSLSLSFVTTEMLFEASAAMTLKGERQGKGCFLSAHPMRPSPSFRVPVVWRENEKLDGVCTDSSEVRNFTIQPLEPEGENRRAILYPYISKKSLSDCFGSCNERRRTNERASEPFFFCLFSPPLSPCSTSSSSSLPGGMEAATFDVDWTQNRALVSSVSLNPVTGPQLSETG